MVAILPMLFATVAGALWGLSGFGVNTLHLVLGSLLIGMNVGQLSVMIALNRNGR